MRKFSFALMTVTFVAVASWGVTLASIWVPVDARALPVVWLAAAVSAVALMFLGSVRRLRNRAMNYLLDAMLTQRARERQTPTVPFPKVVR